MTTWTLESQRSAMFRWAQSSLGHEAAVRLSRKYGLSEEADDLVSITLEKITRSFARRSGPLPDVGNDDQATRYAYRAMANTAIDLARRKRQESRALISVARITTTQPGTDQTATSQVFIEELFSALHRVTASGFTCKACNDKVTYAAATEVLHLALLEGSDAAVGQSWLDDVIYSVVDRYEIGMSRSAAARRQRRSRCRRCVMELLQAALSAIGVRRG